MAVGGLQEGSKNVSNVVTMNPILEQGRADVHVLAVCHGGAWQIVAGLLNAKYIAILHVPHHELLLLGKFGPHLTEHFLLLRKTKPRLSLSHERVRQ